MTYSRSAALTLLIAAVFAGCQRPTEIESEYRTVAQDPRRDTQAAKHHCDNANDCVRNADIEGAEHQLKLALRADLFYGPAHNSLGTVYYKQGKLYLAAWEYQYAAKLMPGRAEPRNNLGMVFEDAGKLDDAAKEYEQALTIEPDRIEIVANLARLRVRQDQKDPRTRELLTRVVMQDDRPEWVAWARERLAMIPPASQPSD